MAQPTLQPALFADPVQPTWTPPKSRNRCTRDPNMGAGSCWYWWEGCPKAETRGCYVAWRAQTKEAARG